MALEAHVDMALAVPKHLLWLACELPFFAHLLLHFGGLLPTHHTQPHASDLPLKVVAVVVVVVVEASKACDPFAL